MDQAPNSKRLKFNKLKTTDLSSFLALTQDHHIRNFLMEGMDVTKEDCKKWIAESDLLFLEKGIGLYLVYEGTNLVGYSGFTKSHENTEKIEVLFALLKTYTKRGLATEICGALIETAIALQIDKKLSAVAHPENLASIQVLKKNGFIQRSNPSSELSHLLHFQYN